MKMKYQCSSELNESYNNGLISLMSEDTKVNPPEGVINKSASDKPESKVQKSSKEWLSRREFLKTVPLVVLAGGALACNLTPTATQPESKPTAPPQPEVATSAPEPTSVPPTPDFWAGKEYPEPMPLDELYAGSLEAVRKAQKDPGVIDMKSLRERLLLPDSYLNSSFRVIARDGNGPISNPDGTPTGYGTSLMVATLSELGWGSEELTIGLTQEHVLKNNPSGREANTITLRQLHLGRADIDIPHVTWSPIGGLDASVIVFKKPTDVDMPVFGLDNIEYGTTKDDLTMVRGLIMPADKTVWGFMGVYGLPDKSVIPPYSEWPRGIHIRVPNSRGCSGASLLNDEGKVFATIHGPYPTAIQDPENPNKYVYDGGFGTFADILPSKESLLTAAYKAKEDYLSRYGND